MIDLALPFPPSVNTYWRHVGKKVLISAKGRYYVELVRQAVPLFAEPMTGRLSVEIVAYPPDRRRRDLDNMLKATLDALQKSGVYHDDEQIDALNITRGDVRKGGGLNVMISEIVST